MFTKRNKINLRVKSDFQVWLFWRMFGVIMIFSIVFAVGIYGVVHYTKTPAQVNEIRNFLFTFLFMGAFINFFSSLLLGILIPHRIAGPIYRMETDLKTIREGDMDKRISLRKEDPLFELSEEINDTVSYFVKKFESA